MTLDQYYLAILALLFAFAGGAILYIRHASKQLDREDAQRPPAE